MNLDNIWQEFLKIVNEEVGSRVVETWFKAVIFEQWDSNSKTAYLKAPNTFVKEWVKSKYQELFKIHLGRLLNETHVNILFLDHAKTEVRVTPATSIEKNFYIAPLPDNNQENKVPLVYKKNVNLKNVARPAAINHSYQFDSFVVGPNNSLAYAAAKAVAEKPGTLYNPLFIYGDSGLGKTHLLHAVGNSIKIVNPKVRILYQSADRFVNEFINAIRFDKINVFESKYRDVDVLLVDDIQFLSNKEQTQEAFFHIFNTLYEAKKQIVFSSDSLPKDIAGLADRLRSRLDGGLITDIQIPTLETKIAILKKKADLHNEPLSDDVAHFIASRVSTNVRELEGLLIRILAFASLTQQDISLELAHKVLSRTTKEVNKQTVLDLQQIALKVAKYYGYTLNELRSTKRYKSLTLARHMAMYLMKKHTENSLADIGAFWRRKDHTTVIHAIEKIEQFKQNDLSDDLQKIENILYN